MKLMLRDDRGRSLTGFTRRVRIGVDPAEVHHMRTLRSTALAVIGVSLVVAPAASAAKPKLYSVSLTATVRSDLTSTRDLPPPGGCVGSATETQHFTASGSLSPKPSPAPVASYGRLKFKAKLSSQTASYTFDTTGGYSVDPADPFPPDPSVCEFTPEHKTRACTFLRRATSRTGGEYAMLPNRGRYQLYYNKPEGVVECEDDDLGARTLLGTESPPTKLRVRAVKRLRKGKRVTVLGTLTTPPFITDVRGGETLDYKLTVKRVR
jgi:hypothetical protein